MILTCQPPVWRYEGSHRTGRTRVCDWDLIQRKGNSMLAVAFVKACLVEDPENRPTIDVVAQHSWLAQMVDHPTVSEVEHVQIAVNFYRFKKANRFQSSVIAFMMGLFQQADEIQRLGAIFEHIDTDKDGFITLSELNDCLKHNQKDILNILGKVPDWEETLSALDTDSDGRMDYTEFLQSAANRYAMLQNEDNL